MANNQIDAIELEDPRDEKAKYISSLWETLNNARRGWLEDSAEVRRYVTAQSTNDTEVGQTLPWKNKTTIPKLTQIADNLQSYYMAALMPTDDWFKFEGTDADSHRKANLIETYMGTKLRMGKFRQELEKLVKDWIIYGNCFASIQWKHETVKSLITGRERVKYIGPKLVRISPTDIVIDPRARSIQESPLVWRKIYSVSEFVDKYKDSNPEAVDKVVKMRMGGDVSTDMVDWYRNEMFRIDGFEDFDSYLSSGNVEVLEFWGDFLIDDTIQKNRKVVICDRSWTVEDSENPSWSGSKPFAHTGWRILPDNLLGQGPLTNLVGMQYRCDHLENLKADAFDLIIHPMIKIKGDTVEEFAYGPGQQIRCGADGDVGYLSPDSSVLACNNEVSYYHQLMELMAGSPKEAMGFRSPGEKTAFEVQVLQQGADRTFQDKLNHFEEHIIQPVLSLMFEMLIRNMDTEDVARTFNDDTSALELTTLTRDDVVADGIFRPIGAKHFEARNKRIQEFQGMQALLQNPATQNHVSGLNFARAYQEELGFEKYNLVGQNVGVEETVMSQLKAQQMQQQFQGAMNQQNETTQEPTGQGSPRGQGTGAAQN